MTPFGRRVLIGLAFVVLVTATDGKATASTLVRVAHWGHENILIYAPLYIAIEAGFFAREGLDVELVYSGNDDQVFATVLSGAAHFGVGDPVFTAVSREKGGEGKVVALLVGRVANWAVAKDPAIRALADPEDLDAYRVTSFPSPSTTFTILSDIKQRLDLKNMQIKEMAFGTEQAALERGAADLAIMLEPQASIAEAQGYRVVWSLAKYYGDFALTGVTTTDTVIAEDPALVQRFVNGLQTALVFAAKSPRAAAVVLSHSFPTLPPDIVAAATSRMVADRTIPPSVSIDRDAWLKTLALRQAVGDLQSLDHADASLDTSFAARAEAGSFEAPCVAAPPSGASAPTGKTGPWAYLAHSADLLSLATFALVLATYAVVASKRRRWSKLSDADRACGPVLVRAFPNPAAAIEEDALVRAIQEQLHRSADVARTTLARFCAIGLLKRRSGPPVKYEPSISWLTNASPLFELWKP